MMTCEDCLHFRLCQNYNNFSTCCLPFNLMFFPDAAEQCMFLLTFEKAKKEREKNESRTI